MTRRRRGPAAAAGRPTPHAQDPTPIETLASTFAAAPRPGSRPAGSGIVTVSRRVEGVRPEGLLRLAAGEARGFWARGGRWIAHAGAVAAIEVPPGAPPQSRFARVQREAAEWTASAGTAAAGEAGADPLRFYGGFAFRDDHHPSGFWESFPPALFLLPRLELEGDASGGARLRLRATVAAGEAPELVREALVRALGETCSALREETAPEAGAPVAAARTEMGAVTWEDAVEQALRAIRGGRFSKVVLARTLDLTTDEPLDPVSVVRHLWRENPGTHVFLFEPRPGRPLLGAAPETVATLRGGVFHATAVAGSIARGETEAEGRALAERLLASAKDLEEHRIAREDMVARLLPVAEEVRADERPHVLSLARIQHLESEIRARAPGRSVLELLEALHPTPAVCGHPRDAALEFLRGEEPFDRGWYAGPVGFFDERGEGVFAPALRSAVAHGRTWRLFAGAGIVAASEARLEWAETGIKFEPVLRALGASGAAVGDVREGAPAHEGADAPASSPAPGPERDGA